MTTQLDDADRLLAERALRHYADAIGQWATAVQTNKAIPEWRAVAAAMRSDATALTALAERLGGYAPAAAER